MPQVLPDSKNLGILMFYFWYEAALNAFMDDQFVPARINQSTILIST